MKIIRIYSQGTIKIGENFLLDEGAKKHVGIVLRMKQGENITIFQGNGKEYDAVIDNISKKEISVNILSEKIINNDSPINITLAQAISKGDRMDMVMQKATELGVCRIVPIITERCVVRIDKARMKKKIAQWEKIVISACEQSGRTTIPIVTNPKTFDNYINECHDALKLVLTLSSNKSWREFRSQSLSSLSLLIGPEGGLSQNEIDTAVRKGFRELSLGPRTLRTETAAISAISILQSVFGDMS